MTAVKPGLAARRIDASGRLRATETLNASGRRIWQSHPSIMWSASTRRMFFAEVMVRSGLAGHSARREAKHRGRLSDGQRLAQFFGGEWQGNNLDGSVTPGLLDGGTLAIGDEADLRVKLWQPRQDEFQPWKTTQIEIHQCGFKTTGLQVAQRLQPIAGDHCRMAGSERFAKRADRLGVLVDDQKSHDRLSRPGRQSSAPTVDRG